MRALETPTWETWRPGVQTRMLTSAINGAGQLCIFEQRVGPGTGAPTHSHPVEEVLTVREGEADMWVGDDHVTVYTGQSLLIPAGRLHGFRNSGTGTLHLHAVLASPIFEATPEGASEPVRRWEAVRKSSSAGNVGSAGPGSSWDRKPTQENRMSFKSRADLIHAIFAAYRANDRQRVEAALSDDFHFTTPFDDGIDKATYFAKCWKNTGWIERHDIERIFVEGEEAFVTYHCVSKDGKSFRNTEFFVFAGDKVRSIDVYFGAAYQHGVFAAQAR